MTKIFVTQKLEIIYKPVSELVFYAQNARLHSEEQVKQIIRSIQRFGWTNPVLIDEEGEIIAGHGRIMAADEMELEQIPCITLAGLSTDEKKAYRIADNKIPLNSGWDDELLKLELAELIDSDFDISLTGFSELELEGLINAPEIAKEESLYTGKIESPIYEPTGDKPAVNELYDESKALELAGNIKSAGLAEEIEQFLLSAAEGHTVFDFSRIADYHAHAPENVQALFEESALVIIDAGQAIENGLAHMTQNLIDVVYG